MLKNDSYVNWYIFNVTKLKKKNSKNSNNNDETLIICMTEINIICDINIVYYLL